MCFNCFRQSKRKNNFFLELLSIFSSRWLMLGVIMLTMCLLIMGFFQVNQLNIPYNSIISFENLSSEYVWECNYLVTGGAGFIGSHLVDRLLLRWTKNKPFRVIVLDNFSNYYSPLIKKRNIDELKMQHPDRVRDGSFIVIRGDIENAVLLEAIFSNFQITHVAHLAALPGVRLSMEYVSNYTKTNIDGTKLLLEQSVSKNISVFVFASTSSVYGRGQQIPFVETDPCDRPLSPYAATKRAAELLTHVYSNIYKLNVTILRLFNVYGPRGRPDMMPAQLLLASIDATRKVTLFDNGTIMRDWTFIDDAVSAFIKALDKPIGYEVLNIGHGYPVNISLFVSYIEQLSGNTKIRENAQYISSTIAEPFITYANVSRAKQILNFSSPTSLSSGLRKTWIWFKNENRNTFPS